MAADEDDDYMGDLERFIPKEELLPSKATSQQTGKGKKAGAAAGPPKANLSWQQKRKLKTEKESSQRQEALTTAIPSSNIGFKMLQQMGYKPGVALGKSGQGATEPITVDLKLNRAGLGRERVVAEEKVLKAKAKAMVQEKKRMKVDELREGFRERRRGSWQRWKLVRDYRKACVALLQLEEASNPKPKAESQGEGPEKEKEKEKNVDGGEDGEEEEEEVITDEMLLETLARLRQVYNYCLYCGFQYDSQAQLQSDCPGEEEDAH